jgi:hypothetical protein
MYTATDMSLSTYGNASILPFVPHWAIFFAMLATAGMTRHLPAIIRERS